MSVFRCTTNAFRCTMNVFCCTMNMFRCAMNVFRCPMNVFCRTMNMFRAPIAEFPGTMMLPAARSNERRHEVRVERPQSRDAGGWQFSHGREEWRR